MDSYDDLKQQLVAGYRRGFAPPEGSRSRVWRAVHSRVGRVAVRKPMTSPHWAIWFVAVPALAAAAVSLVWCTRSVHTRAAHGGAPSAAPYDYSGETEAADAVVVKAAHPRVDRREADSHVAQDLPSTSAPVTEPPPRRRPAAAPPAQAEPAPQTPRIAELVAVLERIENSLRAGRAAGALALLERHRDELASAGLGEEHDAFELVARCRLDQVAEAQAHRDRFQSRHPSSLYAARIEDACATTKRGTEDHNSSGVKQNDE